MENWVLNIIGAVSVAVLLVYFGFFLGRRNMRNFIHQSSRNVKKTSLNTLVNFANTNVPKMIDLLLGMLENSPQKVSFSGKVRFAENPNDYIAFLSDMEKFFENDQAKLRTLKNAVAVMNRLNHCINHNGPSRKDIPEEVAAVVGRNEGALADLQGFLKYYGRQKE